MKRAFIGLIATAAILSATAAVAQTSREVPASEVRGPAPVVPLASQAPAKIIVDPPLVEPLSQGRVVIQYRSENLRIVPVFGPNAVDVSPRIGHIHVFVDDATWRWLDASGEPVTVNGLAPGPHKIRIQLVNANHQPLDQAVVNFLIPEDEHNPPT
jgi:hypothetical protein